MILSNDLLNHYLNIVPIPQDPVAGVFSPEEVLQLTSVEHAAIQALCRDAVFRLAADLEVADGPNSPTTCGGHIHKISLNHTFAVTTTAPTHSPHDTLCTDSSSEDAGKRFQQNSIFQGRQTPPTDMSIPSSQTQLSHLPTVSPSVEDWDTGLASIPSSPENRSDTSSDARPDCDQQGCFTVFTTTPSLSLNEAITLAPQRQALRNNNLVGSTRKSLPSLNGHHPKIVHEIPHREAMGVSSSTPELVSGPMTSDALACAQQEHALIENDVLPTDFHPKKASSEPDHEQVAQFNPETVPERSAYASPSADQTADHPESATIPPQIPAVSSNAPDVQSHLSSINKYPPRVESQDASKHRVEASDIDFEDSSEKNQSTAADQHASHAGLPSGHGIGWLGHHESDRSTPSNAFASQISPPYSNAYETQNWHLTPSNNNSFSVVEPSWAPPTHVPPPSGSYPYASKLSDAIVRQISLTYSTIYQTQNWDWPPRNHNPYSVGGPSWMPSTYVSPPPGSYTFSPYLMATDLLTFGRKVIKDQLLGHGFLISPVDFEFGMSWRLTNVNSFNSSPGAPPTCGRRCH